MLYLIVNRTRSDLGPEEMAELGRAAQEFYDNVPAGITLRGDWAATDGSGTFSLIEAESRELLDRVQEPFRRYVDMEVVEVAPITGWGRR